jgi:hypothetical protein
MNEVDLHEEDENEPSSSTTERHHKLVHTHTHIKISTPKLMKLKLTKSR